MSVILAELFARVLELSILSEHCLRIPQCFWEVVLYSSVSLPFWKTEYIHNFIYTHLYIQQVGTHLVEIEETNKLHV